MSVNPQDKSFKTLKDEFSSDFDSLFNFLDKHVKLHKLWSKSNYKRRAGTDSLQLFVTCLYKLIFSPQKSVRGFFGQLLKSNSQCKNSSDSLYRFMKNSKIDWRSLLFYLTKALVKALPKITPTKSESHSPKFDERLRQMSFLILDDTTITKSGKNIEGLSRIHDHTDNGYKLGFKNLSLCFLKNSLCSIVDFALVSEKTLMCPKKKNRILSQFSKKREKSSFGSKRKKELQMKKTTLAEELLRRARKHALYADYVLFDSWFFNLSLAKSITAGKHGTNFVGGLKHSRRKFIFEGKEFTLKELHKHLKGNKKRNRAFKSDYIEIICELPGFGQVKVFSSKYKGSKRWVYLITNDLNLSYEQTIKIYSMRWNIEICFKELKQYLGLGKCQSTDFDAQVAHMTLAYMLHSIIRFYQVFNSEQTFGEIFAHVEDTAHRAQNLNSYWTEFEQTILWLAEILGGAEQITVSDLFQSSEYKELLALIQGNLRLSLKCGSNGFEQNSALQLDAA